jgi:hypothetical protein
MQTALKADQAAIESDDINDSDAFNYVDGTDGTPTIEAEGTARNEEQLVLG